jgi:hypothetical protein
MLRWTLPFALLLSFAVSASSSAQAPPVLKQDENGQIPKGAKFFIAPIGAGFDIYLSAAMQKKQVPIVLVSDPDKADFELSGVTESDKAGWAKVVFWGNTSTSEQASIKVVNLHTGTVVFGYNVNKGSSNKGKQSTAEACAKHLKEKIESGR